MANGVPADGSDDLDGWFEQLANGTASDPALSGLRTLIAAEGQRAEDSVLGQLAGPQAEQRAVQRLRRRLSEAHHPAPREATRKPWFSQHVRWAVPVFCALLLTVGLSLYQGRDADDSLAPSTARLMHDFYAARGVQNPLSRAQALRQAQLQMLHGPELGAGTS